ncbi:MAG TPA: glycosyltransferase family 39 protein, partial [Pyrinomonadaceae bacterium]|nr:glycosyltransferase family 39 protein [Pyrinomonadaceae bacterium]
MRSATHEESALAATRERDGATAARDDDSTRPCSVSRGELRVVLAWTLAAFALRLVVLLCFEHVISPDGVEYVAHARRLAAGDLANGMSTYWPPLYPALVAVASLVFRDAEFAGRFVSAVAGAALVLPAHRLARRWYGRRAALVCAALVALHPLLVYYSTTLLTESTYTLLFTCAVLAGWSALTGTTARAYAFAGALFGACYLLKPEAFGFVLLLLVMLAARRLLTKTSLRRMKASLNQTSVLNALALVAGFVAASSPQLVYIRWQTGKWFLSAKTSGHLLQGARRAGGDAAADYASGLPDAMTAFVRLAKAVRFEYEIFNLIFPTVFVLLVALGLFRRRWTRARAAREAYLLAFVAAALAGYAVTLPNIRFLAPLVPLLLCWVSKGTLELAAWARGTLARFNVGSTFAARVKRFTAPLVVAVLVASLAPLFVYLMRGDKWGDYYGQKRAGVWIREREAAHKTGEVGRAPAVMSTVPVAAFYAGGRNVTIKDGGDSDSLVARARREGAGYVVVNERDFKRMGALGALLDARSEHVGLRLAREFAEAPDQRVLVYEVEEETD